MGICSCSRTKRLRLCDTLLQSVAIEAIEDPSPLVVAGLHRFLLAVLYRALEGPTDINQAKALFNSGFPGEKITAYLEKWRDRFWLFHEKYPFGQNPYVPKDQIETLDQIDGRIQCDNQQGSVRSH
jgi:CRISPR system Cascade subunit CasA